jgi:prepilin-type N-terminal cleavage/methylation domain-containing protein
MVLSNMLKKKDERGFTLVELLIVIVVIAILAAITIVAYSGITARANTSKAQANAESAQKVAEAMNADNGYYPALASATGCVLAAAPTTTCFALGSTSTKLPSGMSVIPAAATTTITASNGTNTVSYACMTSCSSAPGGYIGYWNFTTGVTNYVYVGTGTGTLTVPTASAYVYPAN